MIDLSEWRGRRVAVLGLARSGRAAAEALARGGAEVAGWDDDAGHREAAAAAGLPVMPLDRYDWSGCDALVISPGIPGLHPRPHPVAAAARAAGREILCDIELLYRARRGPRFVGVTGTNGKSTTTALIGHVLQRAGLRAEIGGNIGRAALTLPPLGADGIYVLEMSSYQLDLVPRLVFDIAVLLNVSVDHLDRHGGMHGYIAAKRRIFAGEGWAVVGTDDDYARAERARLAAAGRRRVIPISAQRPVAGGVSAADGLLVDDIDGAGREGMDLTEVPTLPGAHNWQNAAAAWAVGRALGLGGDALAPAIADYPGLPHRQELVATIRGIRYINDSKATNADSAARALACYRNAYWIAGGLAKESGIAPLAPLFDRIAHAFLIGRAADDFAATLAGHVPWTKSGTLAAALDAAHAMAQADGRDDAVVLLSPACASFDQWPNFEARGDAFRAAVRRLAGERA